MHQQQGCTHIPNALAQITLLGQVAVEYKQEIHISST